MNAQPLLEAAHAAATRGAENLGMLLGLEVGLGSPRILEAAGDPPAASGRLVIATASFEGAVEGETTLALASEEAFRLMEAMLSGVEHTPDDVVGELGASALGEAMSHFAAGVASAMAELVGSDPTVGASEVEVIDSASTTFMSSPSHQIVSWPVSVGDASGRILFGMAPQTAAILESIGDRSTPVASQAEPAAQFPASTLGRLAEVELDVSVELGRSRIPIHELLALDEGGVVRLGRRVGEPVDLMVNGLPTARGEIVVVDGRLGLRVTELIA